MFSATPPVVVSVDGFIALVVEWHPKGDLATSLGFADSKDLPSLGEDS